MKKNGNGHQSAGKFPLDPGNLPRHIAIIMDGNRRWARLHGLEDVKGHENAAIKTIEPLIEKCGQLKIPYVTFWAFSTENWKRSDTEISGLFDVFRLGLNTLAARFIRRGARLRILGDINRFPGDIVAKVTKMIEKSSQNTKINVNFALNYGGRDEIIRAVKKIIASGTPASAVNENLISSNLDTAGMPDPDLLIRTGGEQRTSGYLPWQSVYSEIYFTPTLFPDFTPNLLEEAIFWYQSRDRRLGGDSKKPALPPPFIASA